MKLNSKDLREFAAHKSAEGNDLKTSQITYWSKEILKKVSKSDAARRAVTTAAGSPRGDCTLKKKKKIPKRLKAEIKKKLKAFLYKAVILLS